MSLENPFPGMNPWLESYWQSVHSRFLTYLGDQVSEALPEGLAALTEERVLVESRRDDPPAQAMVSDVAVTQPWDADGRSSRQSERSGADASGGMALAESFVVMLDDPVERSLHIVDGSGELITAVEVLSWGGGAEPKGLVGSGMDARGGTEWNPGRRARSAARIDAVGWRI